jgi:hypothetical protein
LWMAGRATEAVADVSGLLGGPHDLANEGVRLAPAAASIANAAKSDADVVVTPDQGCPPVRQFGDGGQRVEIVGGSIGSAGRRVRRDGKIALFDQPLAPSRKAALLSCHPLVGSPLPPCLPAKPTPACENARTTLRRFIAGSARAICARTDRRLAVVPSLHAHSPRSTAAADLHPN